MQPLHPHPIRAGTIAETKFGSKVGPDKNKFSEYLVIADRPRSDRCQEENQGQPDSCQRSPSSPCATIPCPQPRCGKKREQGSVGQCSDTPEQSKANPRPRTVGILEPQCQPEDHGQE